MTVEIPGYRLISTLGKGGMATVYLAEHEIFGRKVALKVMAPGLADDPSFGQRFMREARIVSQLVHPNIVTVYDVGVHKGNYYLSMEFIDGEDLKHARKYLSLEQKVQIILDIAKALEYAGNKGYVHRDIKPENIMLYTDDSRAVLTDFGIARAAELDACVTQTGTAIGTPHYMSPEQAKGQPVDIRSDIYGLGVVFYLLLVGCVPYDAESAVAIGIKHITDPIPELPPGLEALQPIINKMMAKLPQDRYQKPAQLVNDLQQLDLPALLAAADEAFAEAEDALESNADAPTLVSRTAVRSVTEAVGRQRSEEVPNDLPEEPDPTPLLVNEPFELEPEGHHLWPWLAGIFVLLAVVGGVYYSQYWSEADVSVDQVGQQVLDGFVGALPDKAGDGATDQQRSEPSPNTPAQPESAAEPALPEQEGNERNARLEELRQRIEELTATVETDPRQLAPLMAAWREVKDLLPDPAQAEAAIDDLVSAEVNRIRRLARAGELEAARSRLQAFGDISPQPSNADIAALREFVNQQAQIHQWLEEGERFLSQDVLIEPGASARARFEQVLAVEDDNTRALNGLEQVSDRLTELAANALEQNEVERAAELLAHALEVEPANSEAAALQQNLENAAESQLEEQVNNLLRQAAIQMEEANYFSPPGASAYHYFSQVLEIQPGNSAALEGIERTFLEFEERLFNLLAQNHFEVVRDRIRAARAQLPQNPELAAIELRVEEAIENKLLQTQPRIFNIMVSGMPVGAEQGAQPALVEADRTISVSFNYANFSRETTVIHATLTDSTSSAQIAQVPVVLTGREGTKTFRIDRPMEGFAAGRYTIDLHSRDKIFATREFQVR